MSWLEKLKKGMQKTAQLFAFSKMDFESLEDLEDALLQADVGVSMTNALIDSVKKQKAKTSQEIRDVVYHEIVEKLHDYAQPLHIQKSDKPFVCLMVGVNGAGKTTTIGKLGQIYKAKGFKTAFVAGDTFRAGAVGQLEEWAKRTGSSFYKSSTGSDAAALIFDAIKSAHRNKEDILFVDTAGRLQNRKDLMAELEKVIRVIKKADDTAPHAVLLVLDATVGQNALVQAKAFSEIAPVSGFVMTKLDGTAKGGILLNLVETFKLPVYAIGVGEQVEDLKSFTAEEYAQSLLGE